MFAQLEYKILEELKFGDPDKPGTWLRLEESERGTKVIRHWSTLSKQWNVMYRYNVEENWEKWKRLSCRFIQSEEITKKPKGRGKSRARGKNSKTC
jgi:hypothetical protein